MKKAVALAIVFLVLIVGVVAAQSIELVTNGDFALGVSGWTSQLGAFSVGGSCGSGVGRVSSGLDGAGMVTQCIPLPADATSWTLSAEMANQQGLAAVTAVAFYASNDCTAVGSSAVFQRSLLTMGNSLSQQSTTFGFDTTGQAASAEIMLTSSFTDGPATVACFDNVSLVANDPTAVALNRVAAGSGPDFPLLLLALAGMLLTVFSIMRPHR